MPSTEPGKQDNLNTATALFFKGSPFKLKSQSPLNENGIRTAMSDKFKADTDAIVSNLPNVKFTTGAALDDAQKTYSAMTTEYKNSFSGADKYWNSIEPSTTPAPGTYIGKKINEQWDPSANSGKGGYVESRSTRGWEVKKEKAITEGKTKKANRIAEREARWHERQGNVKDASGKYVPAPPKQTSTTPPPTPTPSPKPVEFKNKDPYIKKSGGYEAFNKRVEENKTANKILGIPDLSNITGKTSLIKK
tara:strand:- start:4155 stop:4901 length:747 start_codon:yes stop_codon:yes gene_type:complete